MNSKINKFRLTILIYTLVETLLVVAFVILYLFNLWELQTYVKPEYFAYGLLVFLVINAIVLFILLHQVAKFRAASDIKTSDVIGNDVNEAYVYGKIGLIVIDQEGVVIWESDYLKSKNIEIINKNIFEYNPQFKEFIEKENNNELNIEINGLIYRVKFLRNSGVFIFKDVSDYELLNKNYKEEATCIGIITIDNYQDITKNNEDNNDIILQVRSEIFNYGNKYNLLIRHLRQDSYFIVCNALSLSKLEQDKFSILQTVKKIGISETLQPTLSIGFASDFPDVNKLNELAASSVDLATSRGGDQAVVSKYGSEVEYFGGKTEALEKRNKVQVRTNANALIGLIERNNDIYIMGHTNMDLDALGAAIAVRCLCTSFGKQARIVFEPKLIEKKTRIAFTSQYSKEELTQITVSPKEALDKVRNTSLVIVVDVANPSITLCPQILDRTDKKVVIDHHRKGEYSIERPIFSYIDPSCSSASEMVTEMIKYCSKSSQIKVDPLSATFILSGIYLDTNSFKSKSVGQRTFEAGMILKEFGADNSMADDFLKDEYEEYIAINEIVKTMQTPFAGIVYCVCPENEIYDGESLSKAANQCMRLKGISSCFVLGRISDNQIKISARSDGSVNVQILCEKMGGGGHFAMAAVAFKNKSLKEVEDILVNTLNDYLSEARSSRGV